MTTAQAHLDMDMELVPHHGVLLVRPTVRPDHQVPLDHLEIRVTSFLHLQVSAVHNVTT